MNLANNKIKFSKMRVPFLDSVLWLKSHRPPLVGIYNNTNNNNNKTHF